MKRRPSSPPAPDVRREASDRLHSAAIHLLRRLRREDADAGLSAARLSALSVVVFGGPITLGALANAEGVRPPTMTRIVAALEEDGLVTREVDAEDRRVARVKATRAGAELMARGRTRRVERLAALLAEVSDDDARRLKAAAELVERLLRDERRPR